MKQTEGERKAFRCSQQAEPTRDPRGNGERSGAPWGRCLCAGQSPQWVLPDEALTVSEHLPTHGALIQKGKVLAFQGKALSEAASAQ